MGIRQREGSGGGKMRDKDGGPAFPSCVDGWVPYTEEYKAQMKAHNIPVNEMGYRKSDEQTGMSLRDWFAGQALSDCGYTGTGTAKDIARKVYEIADAMIAERNK